MASNYQFLAISCYRNVGLSSGPRTYYLKHEFALLEQALVRYTLSKLISKVCGVRVILGLEIRNV